MALNLLSILNMYIATRWYIYIDEKNYIGYNLFISLPRDAVYAKFKVY